MTCCKRALLKEYEKKNMDNKDPLMSERITIIHVTPESNGAHIEAALNAETGTVILRNDQGIHIAFTPRDRQAWDNRLSQQNK